MNHMDHELYSAVTKDDTVLLKSKDWFKDGDQLTPSNNSVLHLACRDGSIRCLKEILRDESVLLQINSRGETALHLAARQGHLSAVKALIVKAKCLDLEANRNHRNKSSRVLQNLIRASNVESETALHAAVRYNHKDVVELLVKEDPSYYYPRNKYEETPLYLAALRRCYDIVDIILENSESPSYGGPHGRTALHAALMNTDGLECTVLLLFKKKDLLKFGDDNGWTAFHYAAHNNLLKATTLLLSMGRSVAYLQDDIYERTALHVAAYKGNIQVMKELLKVLPDTWDSTDGNGQNILHIALKQDQKQVIHYIMSEKNFDTRSSLFIQRDNDGNTPLHLIAKLGYFFPRLKDVYQWTLDWDAVDGPNFTPVDVLHKKQPNTETYEALVGATLNRTSVRSHWKKWISDKALEYEKPSLDEKSQANVKKIMDTHMVVAALITTVALTAGFAMPGGFDGNPGPNQGSPALLKKPAFKIFMVADTIALLFSISTLFLYFMISLNKKSTAAVYMIFVSIALNFVSLTAMMVAFIAGTWVVLGNSKALVISVSAISSLFILLVFYVLFVVFRKYISALKEVIRRSS